MEKNKIKVCHFTSVHSATDGRIFEKECTSLAKAGYEVYLVAPDAEEGVKNGVHIVNVPRKNKGRFYRMFFLSKAVYKKALSLDADIYHFHDPELLLYAKRLKKCGKKVIFDSHEDVPVFIKTRSYLPRFLLKCISYIYKHWEIHVVKKINAVVSVTPVIVERLSQISNHAYQITNYPLLVERKNENIDVAVDFDWNSKINMAFAGMVVPIMNHDKILMAIEELPQVRYLFAGRADLSYLSYLKKMKGYKYATYIGQISKNQVCYLYKHSSIGMALLSYSEMTAGKIGTLGNTKLFEIMESELPVICTDFDLWKNIVEKYNCGICVNPEDVNQIREAIRYLVNHPDVARKMGENGRKAVEKEFNWATQEKVLLEMYDNLQ